jgi:predicted nuclease of predicted toxin-antitoxin system
VIAFKIDENLPIEVRELLRQSGFDALTVLDQNLGGHPDVDVAAVCRSEGRVLLTFDLDFADATRYPPADYVGIIVLRLTTQDKPHVLDVVRALAPHLADEVALRGRLWIVEETRIRVRKVPTG